MERQAQVLVQELEKNILVYMTVQVQERGQEQARQVHMYYAELEELVVAIDLNLTLHLFMHMQLVSV